MTHRHIPLSQPDISQVEIDLVNTTLASGRLSMGPMQERFENMIAREAGCEYGIAVSSGTAGLHLALLGLNVGPGDEVITTPFSFIASANAILYVGAKPVFVDIDPKSLNMDPEKVEAAITSRTKAILAVEVFGNPTYMDAYVSIAARHEIFLIEDACEALGTRYKGRSCGSFGRVGIFGFYPNKQITTCEGGAIVTDDAVLADRCRSLRNQGRPIGDVLSWSATARDSTSSGKHASQGSWLRHERLGYNYRLSELHAAVGVGQLQRFEQIIERRQAVAERYLSNLMDQPDLIVPTLVSDARLSWFVFVVRLTAAYAAVERDRIIEGMRRHDIGAADYFPCIHLQPFYRDRFGFQEGDFPIAESVSHRTIALPFYNTLSVREIDLVSQTLELMISRENLSRGGQTNGEEL